MAVPRTKTTPDALIETESLLPGVSVDPESPTLDEAFACLTQALKAFHWRRDEVGQALGIDTLQCIYADGNHIVAWQKAVLALEVVLGSSLHTR